MPAYPINGRPGCPTCAAQQNEDPERLAAAEVPYPIPTSYRVPPEIQAAKQASKDRQAGRA